jgi:predicted Zn finger-like uncharacterized protein
MLTLCPHCKTVFRVQAPQLGVARGFVECGACERVFNALDHLADEPVRVVAPAPAPAPEVDMAGAADDDGPHVGAAGLNEILIADAEPPMPRIELAAPDPQISLAIDDAPAVLRDDLERLAAREARRGRWAWTLLGLLLVAVLAVQTSWHWRADLLAQFPQLRPPAERLCARVGCRLEQPVTVADIELIARDVRDHPQYARTLLVNATLLNRGQLAAAYPVIQLGVYDRTGVAVGVRRFTPKEYLDRSIDIEAGMPAGRSVYIVLEIAGVGDRADSFEFLFL